MQTTFLALSIVFFLLTSYIFDPQFPNITENLSPSEDLEKSFVNNINDSKIKLQPNSGGVSWNDFNNDGNLDLLITGEKTLLHKNNGNGTFTDVSQYSNLYNYTSISGVFGDYNNDNCPDLYLSSPINKNIQDSRDKLLKNNCNATFTEVSQKAGIYDNYNGQGASWADFDKDGYLDLYVANFGHFQAEKEYQFEPNILYHNNGNGKFSDITKQANVIGNSNCDLLEKRNIRSFRLVNGPFKESYQPVWFDYNNDSWPDLYIATDWGISPLYKNKGNGTFLEVTKEAGLCKIANGMGVAIGDYNNDSYLDIYMTNIGPNILWHNNGDGTFTEMAAEAKVAGHLGDAVSWGTGFLDYDNDGNLDLYVVYGHTIDSITNKSHGELKLDMLFKNTGNGQFLDVSESADLFGNIPKEASAFSDYNNNGFTDIFIAPGWNNDTTAYRLYHNQGNSNNWLTLKLIGEKSNRDAIGARITLKTNNKTQIREIISGTSYLSQNTHWQTFGLGNESIVKNLEINWPSGENQLFYDIKPNQILTIRESGN